MLTGKRFRLKVKLLGIEDTPDSRSVVYVPAGEVVRVLSGPRPDDRRLVDVTWKDRTLVMFADDIQHRADEVDATHQ